MCEDGRPALVSVLLLVQTSLLIFVGKLRDGRVEGAQEHHGGEMDVLTFVHYLVEHLQVCGGHVKVM